jgi:hypothetical protein
MDMQRDSGNEVLMLLVPSQHKKLRKRIQVRDLHTNYNNVSNMQRANLVLEIQTNGYLVTLLPLTPALPASDMSLIPNYE